MTLIDPGHDGQEPVSVADARRWCRIEREDEDALIERLIRAARDTVELETRLVLVRRRFRLVLDRLPPDEHVPIRRGPDVTVTDVTTYDGDGTPVEHDLGSMRPMLHQGMTWLTLPPETGVAAVNGLEIGFDAGFEPGKVPDMLVQAVLRIVASAYEVRGAVAPDMQPAMVPPLARALMAPFRQVAL